MPALPTIVKVALAALLVVSICGAFFGPRPQRQRPVALRGLAVLGVLLYGAAALAVWAAESVTLGALLVIAAVEVICLAAWLARARDDDRRWPPDEDDGPDDPDGPDGDLASLEAALRRWQRERPRSPLAG
jgi:hypothetical protein